MTAHTQIPVIVGDNYQHIMCEATVTEEDDLVRVVMIAEGADANDLLAVMTAGEPMALQFVAIPVTSRSRIKENS